MPDPSVKAAKGHAGTTLRQLGIAFRLYCENNDDAFPAPGSKAIYGPQPEDWIWVAAKPRCEQKRHRSLPQRVSTSALPCPQDQEAITLADGGTMANGSTYAYGYSFTSYDLAGESNRGIGKTYPFTLSSVNNPSGKIMLVDEDRKTLDDSRWVPRDAWGKVNAVAMRHDSKGVVVFADACGNVASPLRLRRTKFQSDFLGKNTMRMQRYEYSNARSINSDLEHVGTLFPCHMRRSKPHSGRWL